MSLFKFSDAILYSTVRNSSLNLRGSRQNRWDTGNKYCIYCTKGSFSRQHLFKIMKYKRYKYLNILHCTKEIKDNFNQWQPTSKRNFSQSLPHPVQFKYIFFHEYSSFLKKKEKKIASVTIYKKITFTPSPRSGTLTHIPLPYRHAFWRIYLFPHNHTLYGRSLLVIIHPSFHRNSLSFDTVKQII